MQGKEYDIFVHERAFGQSSTDWRKSLYPSGGFPERRGGMLSILAGVDRLSPESAEASLLAGRLNLDPFSAPTCQEHHGLQKTTQRTVREAGQL